MKRITIRWERIGRNHDVNDFAQDVDLDDPRSVDVLTRGIDSAIRRHLSSRFFVWSLDPDVTEGTIAIDGGRFGRGTYTITEAT